MHASVPHKDNAERKLDLVRSWSIHSHLPPHWASEIKGVGHSHLIGPAKSPKCLQWGKPLDGAASFLSGNLRHGRDCSQKRGP